MITISNTAHNDIFITHKDATFKMLLERNDAQCTIIGYFGECSLHVDINEWDGFVEMVLAADKIRKEKMK